MPNGTSWVRLNTAGHVFLGWRGFGLQLQPLSWEGNGMLCSPPLASSTNPCLAAGPPHQSPGCPSHLAKCHCSCLLGRQQQPRAGLPPDSCRVPVHSPKYRVRPGSSQVSQPGWCKCGCQEEILSIFGSPQSLQCRSGLSPTPGVSPGL